MRWSLVCFVAFPVNLDQARLLFLVTESYTVNIGYISDKRIKNDTYHNM